MVNGPHRATCTALGYGEDTTDAPSLQSATIATRSTEARCDAIAWDGFVP
jgi:hypothetical protein